MKKYSRNFNRDYDFYLRNVELFDFSGKHPPVIPHDPSGKSAKECFHAFDSTGDLLACKESSLLCKLLVCKASVNLNIKLWVQGMAVGVLCPPELSEYLGSIGAPPWAMRAVLGQSARAQLVLRGIRGNDEAVAKRQTRHVVVKIKLFAGSSFCKFKSCPLHYMSELCYNTIERPG